LLTVDRPDESSCKTRGRITAVAASGYLSNLARPSDTTAASTPPAVEGPSRAAPGTEACPWTIEVRPGQTVSLRVIVLPFDGVGSTSDEPPRRAGDYNPSGIGYGCTASFVIREPAPAPSQTADSTGIHSVSLMHRLIAAIGEYFKDRGNHLHP